MTTKSPNRSPLANPQDDLDLERLEAAIAALEVVPQSLWPLGVREAWDELVAAAARMLLELHDRGLVKFTFTADGEFLPELIVRKLQ